jgi:hypothetical protein
MLKRWLRLSDEDRHLERVCLDFDNKGDSQVLGKSHNRKLKSTWTVSALVRHVGTTGRSEKTKQQPDGKSSRRTKQKACNGWSQMKTQKTCTSHMQ